MNQLRVLIFFAVVWVAVSASSMSTAFAQCVANKAGGPMDKDENGNQVYKIYLYFEADIHQEIAAISPETADDSLTRTQVVQTAMMAAEIWNQQTRGMALVYGGIVNDDTRDEFCAAPPTKRPAIFVHLDEDKTDCGAWFDDGSDWCSGRAVSEVYLKNGGHCESTGSVISEGWPIGSHAWGQTTGVFVHEFGHLLGLGHPSNSDDYSVMNMNPDPKANGGLHVLNWDKNCVDSSTIDSPGRKSRVERFTWKPDGTLQETVTETVAASGWTQEAWYSAPDTIDPPTFGYYPNREVATIWTLSE